MSQGLNYLHSHSGIERELGFPKHKVLIDEEYADLFIRSTIEAFHYNSKLYYSVDILDFVGKGGLFKNLMK